MPDEARPSVDGALLSLLACPRCRKPIRPDEAAGRLVCDACRLGFPVRDGVPIMLLEEAHQLD